MVDKYIVFLRGNGNHVIVVSKEVSAFDVKLGLNLDEIEFIYVQIV